MEVETSQSKEKKSLEQKETLLKEVWRGKPVSEACQEIGISRVTYNDKTLSRDDGHLAPADVFNRKRDLDTIAKNSEY